MQADSEREQRAVASEVGATAELRVRLLGPVTAFRDGRSLPLGGPKQRAVLAMLVLRPGEHLGAHQLAAGLWGAEPPASAVSTLRAYVSRLRAALGAEAVQTTAAGHALVLSEDGVDASRFSRGLSRARSAAAAGAWSQAVTTARAALAEWHGEALGDLQSFPFGAAPAARLERERRDALHLLVEAELHLGEHAEVVPRLQQLVEEHPNEERFSCQLMLAQYRCGHQHEALAAYARLRARLVEELGVEPGTAARALHQAVLRQDPQLDVLAVDDRRAPGAVPPPALPLVGRTGELSVVRRLLGEERLITLTGPAGIGKSRLAVELAREVARRRAARLVGLRAVLLGRALAPHVAATLGVHERPGAPWEATLARVLRAQDLLLVLDGCDGIGGAVLDLVTGLLPDCPALTVLVTGREPLGAPGERVVELGPLPTRDAVALLVARAPSGGGVDSASEALPRVAEAVDGNPLALELAAGRLGTVGAEELVDQLRDRDGTVLAWSVAHLAADARRLLGRLAVFTGAFDAERAAAVAGADVSTQLAELLRAALVSVAPGGAGSTYRLLPPVAELARVVLTAERDADDAAAAHARAHAELAERAYFGLRGPNGDATLRQLDSVVPDLSAALVWSLDRAPVTALRLAGALAWSWYRRGRITEGRTWCDAALAAAGDGAPPALAARAGIGSAVLAYLAGNLHAMDAALLRAVERADTAGDPALRAQAHLYRVWARLGDDPEVATDALAAAQGALGTDGPGWLEAEVAMTAGALALARSDPASAERELERARELASRHGHAWSATSATWQQAKLALRRDDPGTAHALHLLCLRDVDVARDLAGGLVTLNGLAAAIAVGGDPRRGARLLGAVSALGDRIDYDPATMDPVDGPRHVAQVRERLSEPEWHAAYEQGRLMTWDDVVSLAAAPPPTATTTSSNG